MRLRRGFTTVELVIVILVVGILASFAAPVVGHLASIRSAGVTNRLVDHIRYAQSLAMSTHQRVWLTFDVGGNSYSAFIEDPASPGKANRIAAADPLELDSWVVDLDDDLLSGVSLSSVAFDGEVELEFDSTGAPYDGDGNALSADGTIVLSDTTTISVAMETGYASVTP